jgi:exodeoxyribonuclease-1
VARLHEGAGGLTVARFLERVDELAEAAAEQDDERGQLLLEALVDYAEQIAPAHG